jgi:hypothetical protein
MRRRELSIKQGRIISDRSFWLGLAVYALLFIATANAFAGILGTSSTDIIQRANRTGTLIFGERDLRDTNPLLRYDNYHSGAVTLHGVLGDDFSTRLNRMAGNLSRIDPLIGKVAEVPNAPASVWGGNQSTYLAASNPGITPMQIALWTPSSVIREDLTPVPEPATWFAAVLVTGAVAWSQRRRLARSCSAR